jgi:integrase
VGWARRWAAWGRSRAGGGPGRRGSGWLGSGDRDAEGRQRSRSFARKPDAERFLTLVQADLLRGSYVDPGRSRPALSVYADLWLSSLSVRPSTRRTYGSHLRTWILPVLGARTLASITPADVWALVRQLTEQLAPSTAHHVHGLLSSILQAAVEDGYLARNPAARTAPRRGPRRAVRPLSVEQGAGAARGDAGDVPGCGAARAGCGLPVGEVLGLPVSAVNLTGRELVVSQQLQALVGQPLTLRPPKSYSSARTVPLPDVVAAGIVEHLRRWPPAGGGELDLLVRSVSGRPVWPRTFHSRIWRTATTKAGLPGVRFHQLRHFYASALIRAGESVKTVQVALGHASAVETLQIYVGLCPDNDQSTRAAIDDLDLNQPAIGVVRDISRTGVHRAPSQSWCVPCRGAGRARGCAAPGRLSGIPCWSCTTEQSPRGRLRRGRVLPLRREGTARGHQPGRARVRHLPAQRW